MARGFISGLVQGTALGAGALVVLSLIAPPPAGTVPPPQVAAPLAQTPETQAGTDAPPRDAVPATEQASAPAAPAIDLPAGSEFGRGTNARPQLPDLREPEDQALPAIAMPQAPASVSAPAADTEPRSRLQSEAASLPGTEGFGGPVQPVLSDLALPDVTAAPEPAIDSDGPQPLTEAASVGAPPQFPDLPMRLDQVAPAPEPEPVPEPEPEPVPASQPDDAAAPPAATAVIDDAGADTAALDDGGADDTAPLPAAAPAGDPAAAPQAIATEDPQPAPSLGIDLSLPPDLSQLRVTGEN